MSKVLILYFSAYGHIEQMAKAVAEGARKVAGAEVTHQARAGAVGRGRGQARRQEARPERAGRDRRGACRLRCDHLRHADPVRQHGGADARLPRRHRPAVGCRRPGRQGRQRVHQQRHAAWRPGVDDPDLLPHLAAPRHGARRPALHLHGADGRWPRSPAARPTAPARSRPATARASHPRTSSAWRASRASTWRASPRSLPLKATIRRFP